MILALCGIRFIHLGADSPSKRFDKNATKSIDAASQSFSVYADGGGIIGTGGLYVDEGYKTLSPRNMILFGGEHWNSNDDYSGWMKGSPFTQWAYYLSFKAFGVNIKSARAVTVMYFFVFLCIYAYIMSRYYDTVLFFSGIVMLGIHNMLFFLSRTALFETPLILFAYSLLLILKKKDNQGVFTSIALILLVAYFSASFIKQSSLIYLFPVFLGSITALSIRKGFFKKRITTWWIPLLMLCCLAGFLLLTRNVWASRIQFSISGIMWRVLFYPPIVNAPAIVLAGLLCGIHGLLCRPREYLSDVYRASLLGIILLSPVALALFKYNPTRYYVPILPAYLLLCFEWVSLKSWNHKPAGNRVLLISSVGIIIMLCILSFYFLFAFNVHILSILPFNLGDQPGVSFRFMVTWFPHIAALLSILTYAFKKVAFSKRIIAPALSALLVLGLFYNLFKVGHFMLTPSYQSEKIGAELSSTLSPDAIIIGDWAPLFALNTRMRALYMSDVFNTASRIKELKPDYFVFTSTKWSYDNMSTIEKYEDVSLGQPVYKSKYIGKKIIIYPIIYKH